MAKRLSAQPAPKAKQAPPQLTAIQADRGWPPGMPGVIRILAAKAMSAKGAGFYQHFGGLSDVELLGLRNCAGRAFDNYAITMKALGQVIVCYHPGPNAPNLQDEIGDMVTWIAELMEEARELEGWATDDLAIRGYNFNGEPLGGAQ